MPKYDVEIHVTKRHSFYKTIDAESQEEAKQMAFELSYDNEGCWSEKYIDTDSWVTEIKDNKEIK